LEIKAKIPSVFDVLTISHNGLKAKNPSMVDTYELTIAGGYFAIGTTFIIASGSES